MTLIKRAAYLVHPRNRSGMHQKEGYYLNVEYNGYDCERKSLVLLHGYLGNSSDYDHAFEKFNLKYNLLAIDLRAHGQSHVPNGEDISWSIPDLAYDIQQVIDQVFPHDTRYHIVASSMATAIALELAGRHKDIVESLFLISPTNKFEIPSWANLVLNLSRVTQVRLFDSLVDLMVSTIVKVTGKDNLELGKERFSNIKPEIHKKYILEALKTWEANIDDLNIPIFMLAGLKDKIIPHNNTLELIKKLSNASLLTFVNEEHHLIIKQTKVVFDLLDQWLLETDEMLEQQFYMDDELLEEGGTYCIHSQSYLDTNIHEIHSFNSHS